MQHLWPTAVSEKTEWKIRNGYYSNLFDLYDKSRARERKNEKEAGEGDKK